MFYTIMWIVLLAAFVIIEAATVQLVTIWFAAGALAALIAEICGAKIWLQLAIFVGVSVIALIATRPFVKKFTKNKFQPTNADRCIGDDAIVTEAIDNTKGTGSVNVKGTIWSARSSNGEAISQGETVTIEKIDGVKLIVSAKTAVIK